MVEFLNCAGNVLSGYKIRRWIADLLIYLGCEELTSRVLIMSKSSPINQYKGTEKRSMPTCNIES